MNAQRSNQDVPDWKLERYLLGDLPREDLAQIQAEIYANPALQERLDALEQSNREILEAYPPGWMARQIRERANGGEKPKIRMAFVFRPWWLSAVAAVVVFAFVTTLWTPESELTRLKGLRPHLILFRKTETGSERLVTGALAREHDLIRVVYQAAGRAYGVILSADGRGAVTVHLPSEGARSVRLETRESTPLDFAYELDDAPHWERFYFITADTPFAVPPIVQAAQRQLDEKVDSLRVPAGFDQFIFTLRKGSTP